MTTHRNTEPPIVRFLGDEAGRGGPFSLLGLSHAIDSESEINRAVQRRLRQIDCHPHRSTPDAGEVRLAVHSAASQLRDPDLRAHLAKRWPEGTPIDLPKAWSTKRAMQKLTPALIAHARLIVGSSGGWNPIARRRLANLARLNRVGAIDIIRELGAGFGTGKPVTGSIAQTQTQTQTQTQNQIPRLYNAPAGLGSFVAAYAVLGLLACTLVVTVAMQPSRSPRGSTPTAAPVLEGLTDLTPANEPEQSTRERLTHYTAIAHELDRIVARAPSDPQGAMKRFSEIYPRFIEQWTTFPHDALQRASVNIAELIVRLESAGIPPERLIPLLATAGASPDREMLVAGTIDVTLGSSSLTAESRAALNTLRRRISDSTPSPQRRVLPAILSVARHQARQQQDDDPQWWQQWVSAAAHASAGDQEEHDSLILEALSARLSDADSPDEQWLRVASMLVRRLGWRDSSDERYWLLAQFGDDRVSTPRLAMLTEALVSASAAEGVDARMELSRTANDPQRKQMAHAYEAAWFTPVSAGDQQRDRNSELLNQLRIAAARLDTRIDDQRAIEEILTLTVLSAAAHLHVHGEALLSQELLQNPPALTELSPSPMDRTLRGSPDDNAWAQQAINVNNAAELLPMIDQLLNRDTIGLNSAHALVYLAISKPELELRELAKSQLVRSKDQIGVLIALDHALTDQRISSRLADLTTAILEESLPARTDPIWFMHARQAVLTRMGESFARSQQSKLNALERELAILMDMQLLSQAQSHDSDGQGPQTLLSMLNRNVRLSMQSHDSRMAQTHLDLADADALATVMRARSHSPLHQYHAEQVYALRLSTIDLAARFPGVSALLDEYELERLDRVHTSGSILQQIAHTQRTLVQLRVIELDRGGGR